MLVRSGSFFFLFCLKLGLRGSVFAVRSPPYPREGISDVFTSGPIIRVLTVIVLIDYKLITPPYAALAIQGRGSAILCKGECIMPRNQRIVSLTSGDDVSLVIERLCDEAVEGETAVDYFYCELAARNKQSPLNKLGPLLRLLGIGLEEIPEA